MRQRSPPCLARGPAFIVARLPSHAVRLHSQRGQCCASSDLTPVALLQKLRTPVAIVLQATFTGHYIIMLFRLTPWELAAAPTVRTLFARLYQLQYQPAGEAETDVGKPAGEVRFAREVLHGLHRGHHQPLVQPAPGRLQASQVWLSRVPHGGVAWDRAQATHLAATEDRGQPQRQFSQLDLSQAACRRERRAANMGGAGCRKGRTGGVWSEKSAASPSTWPPRMRCARQALCDLFAVSIAA